MSFMLVVVVALIASCVAVNINKCCRAGDVVQVGSFDDDNYSPGRHFDCVDPLREVKIRDSGEHSVNILTIPDEMIAYNILVDENSHWPACSDNSNFSNSLSNESAYLSESASCIDIMDGLYFTFSCEERLEVADDLVNVYKLRKCCDKNHSYDVFKRQCVRNNYTSLNDEYGTFLGANAFVFELGLPQCNPDDVLVEYHSLVHKLEVLESSLIISHTSSHRQDVVPQGSYCIESSLNSKVSIPDGADPTQHELKASSKWIAKTCRPRAVCDEIPCVQKCCEEGHRLVQENKKTFCEPHDAHLSLKFHFFKMRESRKWPRPMEPTDYGLLKFAGCEFYTLGKNDGEYFYSAIDGSLYLPKNKLFFSNERYCIDNLEIITDQVGSEVKIATFVCQHKQPNERFRIYATILAISAAFLALTFVVYILLPKLLNLHGKILMCHVLSLFAAYSFLSAAQFSTDERMTHCKSIAFSWLNVMCVDIFWTFGSIRMRHEIRKKKELKRFIYYSIYAWGFPCLATIACFMMDSYHLLPPEYSPNIGVDSCWFEHISAGHVIFFLFPVGFQICVNIVLFVITAIHCNRVKHEIHRMQRDDSCEQKKKPFLADKAILLTNLKLLIVMGVPWLLEILASIWDTGSMLWIVSDIFNLLQGVFIFFIFVFKRRVLTAFQQKLGIRCGILRRKKRDAATSSNLRSTFGFHARSSTQNTRVTMINMSLR